ncbi:hypothetical protein BE221DRAFT_208596 [Ostreococcus tauri]|uniref:Uncharacterized protein n=1 Tax=Ostreococcus tauri TaxID=70448 RepID=A0A1Y5I638_OSTTA|nr:hypothetical protein BE221DRAFT_208596 [Ostreococcus tauri]
MSRATTGRRPRMMILWAVVAAASATAARGQFERAVDYDYRVCSEQSGEYDVELRAMCVSVDAGELGFCSGIAYDACVRTDPPLTQDKRVTLQFDRMTKMQTAIAPELAADPIVWRCDPDPVNTSKYYELPACWEYCMNAVFACMGEMDTARDVCNRSVYAGVVASQDRPDVKCVSAGSAVVTFVATAVTMAISIALA